MQSKDAPPAAAPAAEAGKGSPNGMLMNVLFIGLMIAVFYFFMIRPQMKKQKEIKKFREALKVNDKVITAGGLHGKIREVKETAFVIEVAEGVKVTVEKSSVFNSAEDMVQR